jgi:Abnormal spindle-like microcephaly-assoc'd, ASPM-SPD-2-Hydin/Repeat of unknown function (DUF5648)
MQRSLLVALVVLLALAWSALAPAASCPAGKQTFLQICQGCHAPDGLARKTATDIFVRLNTEPEMQGLYPDIVDDTDIGNIVAYLALYPASCTAGSANVGATPDSLSFGNVAVGAASASKTVTLTNSGTAGAAGLTFASSDAAEFPVTQSCGATLGAGASCTLDIAYAPGGVGADNATLIVSYGGGSFALSFSGTGVAPAPPTAVAIEYHHQAFDHYFITTIADEITKLDNGTFVGWARTGKSFKVNPTPGAGLNAVCRFFSTAFDPKSSHFYTPDPGECTTVKANANWLFEGEVFFAPKPAVDGACPASSSPVYRVYNNGQGAAPNHRYTTDLAVRSAMLAQGWVPEGYGDIGVIMCAKE